VRFCVLRSTSLKQSTRERFGLNTEHFLSGNAVFKSKIERDIADQGGSKEIRTQEVSFVR
jgi:hypothetical protein